MRKVAIFIALVFAGCDRLPEKTTMSDPRVKELVRAAAAFDRTAYGFTPIPEGADVQLETHRGGGYDRMLHIYSKTSRTIAFRETPAGYKWISEQEIFEGPRRYTTVDGTFNESIALTYEVEALAHYKLDTLNIDYFGDDPRLEHRPDLSVRDVNAVLKEWGYER